MSGDLDLKSFICGHKCGNKRTQDEVMVVRE